MKEAKRTQVPDFVKRKGQKGCFDVDSAEEFAWNGAHYEQQPEDWRPRHASSTNYSDKLVQFQVDMEHEVNRLVKLLKQQGIPRGTESMVRTDVFSRYAMLLNYLVAIRGYVCRCRIRKAPINMGWDKASELSTTVLYYWVVPRPTVGAGETYEWEAYVSADRWQD
ncbi:hypothetical protein ASPCAL02877 [Aspergillus calidoustus]|uniref:Uncharacterized protein n=1 Tax=Aspergillus calidoustus TaxID=454130 RepID=A0A0U5GPY0_ASPCI|nr:hypothetical protein ASPCAL02877 [Aspergillus calidoustus]